MSYILDALNKSEEEKKQHRTPGLNTIHQKPGNRNQGKIPLWALVVGGVVFVGFLGLIVWFVLLADTPQTADVTVPLPAKAQPIIRQPQLQNPGLDRESRVVSPAPARPVSPMPARQSRQRPVAQADHFQAGLTPQIKQEISAIRFSSHIFANDASLRMVVINGQSLREGNRFDSGLLLQKITEEGVVIVHQNHEVPISVLSQWADD